jgi:hypothetical protein
MPDTSLVPSFQIQLGKELRTLRYAFRAFKLMGLNPFQPKSMADFLGANLENLDVDKAAAWIRAGLAWEYAKDQPRYGQEMPTVDELIDLIDIASFMRTFNLSIEVAGLKGDGEEGQSADPQTA